MTGVVVRYGDGTMGEVCLDAGKRTVFWRSGAAKRWL